MKNKQFISFTRIIFIIMILAVIWTSFITVLTWLNKDVPDVASIGFGDLHQQSIEINDQLQKLATSTAPNMSAEEKNMFRNSVITNPPETITKQYQAIVGKMTLRWVASVTITILIGASIIIIKNATNRQSIFSRQLSHIVLIWGIVMIVLSTFLPLLEGCIGFILTGTFSIAINYVLLLCGLAVIWFSQAFKHANAIQEELDMVI